MIIQRDDGSDITAQKIEDCGRHLCVYTDPNTKIMIEKTKVTNVKLQFGAGDSDG